MIDRALLRRAWPDGYLTRRGVSTVGGWTCACAARDGSSAEWLRVDRDSITDKVYMQTVRGLPDPRVARGDLLPIVDPAETATWACLLADLAEALNARIDQKRHGRLWPERGLCFVSRAPGYYELSDGQMTWTWQCPPGEGLVEDEACGVTRRFPPWCEDPAEALVWIRICEREAGAA